MANLLYLVHRMPYPPDKGDKVRSYHLLKHLVANHRVFVGTFIDDPADEAHVIALRALCAGLHVSRLHGPRARIASLAGLLDGQALTLRYYADAALRRWVQATAAAEGIDAVVVFSSSMAQYAEGLQLPMLVDFVDVDSAKWTEYANHHRWPMSWLYRREGRELLAYERSVAQRASHAFFVTEKENALFHTLAPEAAGRSEAMSNGVDADFFAPDPARASPFAAGETPVVFTGAMDYWPNIDAVRWFASDALPALRERFPRLRFHIVGRNPAPAVRALAGEAVTVTGTVPDVRPFLQHAGAVVAPLRLARGLQNKVLEAMASARPVVTTPDCRDAIAAGHVPGLSVAADAAALVRETAALLASPVQAAAAGHAAREFVQQRFSWPARLATIDQRLQSLRLAA